MRGSKIRAGGAAGALVAPAHLDRSVRLDSPEAHFAGSLITSGGASARWRVTGQVKVGLLKRIFLKLL